MKKLLGYIFLILLTFIIVGCNQTATTLILDCASGKGSKISNIEYGKLTIKIINGYCSVVKLEEN